MKFDEQTQAAVDDLSDAINSAIAASREIGEAIENLRLIGYEPNLTLKLEIALARVNAEVSESLPLTLSEDDRKILRRMKIRAD